MAAHSNRSPSPLCSRPSNPISRIPENNRRSFSGTNPFAKPSVLTNPRRFDPITPANSPSDFARRRSVSKDCEEKENDEKDHILKASKFHSPVKGSKNFMSPTISAASKFTPSPRKKVLVERNDPVRTSISLSEGKAMFFSSNLSEEQLESKSEMGYHHSQKEESSSDLKVADSEKKKAVSEGHPVSKPSKRVSFSDIPSDSHQATESLSESVITDSDSLKLDSVSTDSDRLKLESSVTNQVVSPRIAPLDADPSLPPYDPKTNYLSPRPQFLHYKPNPRIELLLKKEKGLDPDELKKLEDGFVGEIMSDNFSESEATEESQTEDSHNEEMAASSADMVIGMDEMEVDSRAPEPSESLPVSTNVTNAISEEDLVEKNEKKPRVISRLMCISMLVMFLIACVSISVTNSSSLDEIVIKDLSFSDLSKFYHQSRFAASAKVNFDKFVKHVDQLSVISEAFISKLANELVKGGQQGQFQFMNLSDLQKNTWNGEEDELEEDLDKEFDVSEEEEYAETDSDEKFAKESDVLVTETDTFGEETYGETDSDENFEKAYDTQEIQSQREVESSINAVQWNEQNSGDEPAGAIPQSQEIELEAAAEVASVKAEHEKFRVDTNSVSSALADTTSSDNQLSTSDVSTLSEGVQISAEDNSFVHYAMGASSLFAALLAVAAAFVYQYKKNPRLANVVQADPVLSKQTAYGLTGIKQIQQEKEFSENGQTEVNVSGGESCPSEMSSSFASYNSKKGASEVQSSERKTRRFSKRESLASSSEYSMGSTSYGSFTTYERVPIKHANGDEEIMTPVRRSSRIRNHQVTSP